ncbi:MAG: DNA-3-methyladenine glycosylase [Phycisphaerales bacterium]|nr:DNA-3-methyladenine glycosylase [Phycisphaerales bacterium]
MPPRRRGFAGDAAVVARSLLGQRVCRSLDGALLVGRIVEVEAYLGPGDLACHTAGGRRTERNESMYLGGGHAYVYLIYGMHHCLNITTGPRGSGAAVLVRAVEPLEGIPVMEHRRGPRVRGPRDLCRGPGRLCEAFGIDRELDGLDLRTSELLWIERCRRVPDTRIHRTARVGLGKNLGTWMHEPLRFSLREDPYVSAPRPPQQV